MDEDVRRATERWFIRRGLPHFIHPYRATEDVFTRMLPILAVILVFQVVADASDERWSPLTNLVVVVAVLAVLVGAYATQNRLRRRPAFSRPDRVGVRELSVFVLLPTVAPLAKLEWGIALANVVINVSLLGLIYVVTSFGLVPMARWTLAHGLHRLASAASVLLRALPLLLLIVIVVFVNMEAWQVADGLQWTTIGLVVALFFVLGAAFAAVRVPRQVDHFGRDANRVVAVRWWDAGSENPSVPIPGLLRDVPAPPSAPPPALSRRERINVALVVLVSEGILVTLVTAMMFGFLVIFGMLTITPAVVERWLDQGVDVLATWELFGQELVLTPTLLKVAAFLAALSGLSFTVSLLSDATYQEEFLADLDRDLGDAFAVRAIYRAGEPTVDPSIIPST